LDEFEAKFALQAFGLYPSVEYKKRVMEELRLNYPLIVSEFHILIEALDKKDCKRGLVSVPYARRGISLRQLKKLASGLLDMGWLQSLCDKHNQQHREAIDKGEKFTNTTNLYAMDEPFVRETTRAGPNTRRSIPKEVLHIAEIPKSPEYDCCFAQLLNPEGLDVDYFISHWWGHNFRRTVEALIKFAGKEYRKIGKHSPDDVVFWICLYALNQHQAKEEVGETPEQGPFNIALAKSKHGVLMILDEDAHPMRRIWCLYEVYRAKEFKKEFRLIVDDGDLTSASLEQLEKISDRLTKLRAVTADSSFESDRRNILYRIMDEGCAGRNGWDKFEKFNKASLEPADEWMWMEFDVHMCSLMGAPMFTAGMAAESASVCLQAIGMGANNVTVADLQTMKKQFGADLSAKVTTRFGKFGLAHVFARNGMLENLSCVMDGGAEVEDKTEVKGWTVLQCAVWSGHAEICTMLIQDRGAQTDSGDDIYGSTALMFAAFRGHTNICNILLDNGAEVHAKNKYGWSALQDAAVNGHAAVCTVLLDRGAEVNAKMKYFKEERCGSTVLHFAALNGHAAVCTVLLDRGAEVNAKNDDGKTALDDSKSEEVSKILVERGGKSGQQ